MTILCFNCIRIVRMANWCSVIGDEWECRFIFASNRWHSHGKLSLLRSYGLCGVDKFDDPYSFHANHARVYLVDVVFTLMIRYHLRIHKPKNICQREFWTHIARHVVDVANEYTLLITLLTNGLDFSRRSNNFPSHWFKVGNINVFFCGSKHRDNDFLESLDTRSHTFEIMEELFVGLLAMVNRLNSATKYVYDQHLVSQMIACDEHKHFTAEKNSSLCIDNNNEFRSDEDWRNWRKVNRCICLQRRYDIKIYIHRCHAMRWQVMLQCRWIVDVWRRGWFHHAINGKQTNVNCTMHNA